MSCLRVKPSLQNPRRRCRVRSFSITALTLNALLTSSPRFSAAAGALVVCHGRRFAGESLVLGDTHGSKRFRKRFAKLPKRRRLRVLTAVGTKRNADDQLRDRLAAQYRLQRLRCSGVSNTAVDRAHGQREVGARCGPRHANPSFTRVDPNCASARHLTTQAELGLRRRPNRALRRACPLGDLRLVPCQDCHHRLRLRAALCRLSAFPR